MKEYKYWVNPQCYEKIYSFYYHVALKYKHTYSEELMHKNIDDAVDSMYQIEHTLSRRRPTIAKWEKYHMANTDKWYFAYTIMGDMIIIEDACHAQNMYEDNNAL